MPCLLMCAHPQALTAALILEFCRLVLDRGEQGGPVRGEGARSVALEMLEQRQTVAVDLDRLARPPGQALSGQALVQPVGHGLRDRVGRTGNSNRSLTCKNSVELRGFEPLTPSMRTGSLPSADVAHCS